MVCLVSAGLLIWWGMLEAGMMQGLPIASLVLLLDAAVPTAQNMVLLFLVHGKPEHGHVSPSDLRNGRSLGGSG